MSESKNKIIINDAAWLKPGWILASLAGGGFQVTKVEITRDNMSAFANSVLDVVEELNRRGDAVGIFLAKDDCAIVSEYHPRAFKRTRK